MTAANENRLDTDVLIVGAGPTGLALATTLTRAGIVPIIVDKLTTGQNTSRAAVIHAHTLEVLEELGVSDRLAEEGLKLVTFSIRDRDRVLARLRFDTLPTRYAYLLMLPQDMTEKILVNALAEANGAVRWGHTVESLVEKPDGIQATVVSNNLTHTINARYVVGVDASARRATDSDGDHPKRAETIAAKRRSPDDGIVTHGSAAFGNESFRLESPSGC